MSNFHLHQARNRKLNEKETKPHRKYVLYWMQQSQRAWYNHALEFAVDQANQLKLPLLVVFGLTDNYPDANVRHFYFMLQGLNETIQVLKKRNIKMLIRKGSPEQVAIEASKNAAVVICDTGYLKHQRKWRQELASKASCTVVEIESDLIVPIQTASSKAEYAARTIRKKLHLRLEEFLDEVPALKLNNSSIHLHETGMDISNIDKTCAGLNIDHSVPPVPQFFQGGTSAAEACWDKFLNHHFNKYQAHRNRPETNDISHMSIYLHFGQISAVWLARQVQSLPGSENTDAYLEELLVRRELAANYVYFTKEYDKFNSLPDWALKTLHQHEGDPRGHLYDQNQLELAETHDPYWNASMKEMKFTGFMHNYMRMYWGKKILEWSSSPEKAYQVALNINNKYFLDGRDFNSYTNISWLFGQHDRGWKERPVYGKVRSMMASGLERKFDTKAYIQKVERLVQQAKNS